MTRPQAAGSRWVRVVGGVVLLVVVVLVALGPADPAPAAARAARALGPEEAWDELRDTSLDLRLPWPQQRSPWQTREALVQLFGAPRDEFTPERPRRGPDTNPDAVFALDRIVHSLERLRYARADGSEPGTWRAEMETCVEALYGGATKRARRSAVVVAAVGVRAPGRRSAARVEEPQVERAWPAGSSTTWVEHGPAARAGTQPRRP